MRVARQHPGAHLGDAIPRVDALTELDERNVTLVFAGLNPRPREMLERTRIHERFADRVFATVEQVVEGYARTPERRFHTGKGGDR